MRAAGHYPSQADTGSLLAHVRFLADMAPADDATVCSTSGGTDAHGTQQKAAAAAASQVDLDTFLLLYLSHRPVVDVSRRQVEAAFRTLGASTAAGAGATVLQAAVVSSLTCAECVQGHLSKALCALCCLCAAAQQR
jgi:hypothetical protein